MTPELGETFGLFAQQLGALIENRKGRTIIEQQMAEIRHADRRLRMMCDNVPDMIWAKDLENRYLFANRAMCEQLLLAADTAEPVGKTDLFFAQRERASHPENPEWHTFGELGRESDRITLCRGAPSTFEETANVRGQFRYLDVEKAPFIDEHGTIIGTVGSARDVTDRKQAEATIRSLNADLAATLQAIPDILFDVDLNGTYLNIWAQNPALLAHEKEVLLGRTVVEMLPAEAASTVMSALHEANEKGTSFGKTICLDLADGKKWFELSVSKKSDTDGLPARFIALSRDVTSRRQAEEQVRKLSLAVDQNPSSIVITNLDAKIEYVNDAFLRTTGYTKDEILGLNPRLLGSGKTPKATYESLWNTLQQGDVWKGEFLNRRKDGNEYVEFAIVAPIRQADGTVTHYLAIKEDVTEKKLNAAELNRHRHHLMDLVAERTLALSIAKEAAEAANRAQRTFLANMSHEIRTPMNAIIGMTHLLSRNIIDPGNSDKLGKISDAARHLLQLLNNILDLSKIDAEHLTLERSAFTVSSLLRNIESLSGVDAHSKQIQLNLELSPALQDLELLGDPLRLQQVLLNLINNAIKFTEQGSVTLNIRLEAETGSDVQIRFAVTDTGIGMSPAVQSRIFDQFEQADSSTTRKFGGSGLGLTICRHLIRLMGADIDVVSTTGQGSTFSFALCLEKASAGRLGTNNGNALSPGEIESALRRLSDVRILVVEDNWVNQEVIIELLRDIIGFNVDLAQNGSQAVDLAALNDYGLILMDMQLPEMDGTEATRRIRRMSGRENLPIIAMTANAFAEDEANCRESGMNDFITKPVNPDLLFAMLLRWLAPRGRNA